MIANILFMFSTLKLPVVLLMVAVVFVGLGEKLFERFLPKYLESLGETIVIIGLFGAIQNIINAVWSIAGGYLSDHIGYRKSLIAFTGLAMIGYIIPVIAPNWVTIFIGMALFTAWPAMAFPAIMTLINDVLKKENMVMGVSMHSLIRRIPMAAGPVTGGFLIGAFGIKHGINLAMGTAFILGIAGIFVLYKIPIHTQLKYEPIHPLELWKRMDTKLKHLLLSDTLIRFCEQIPNVFVVLWCLNIAHVSPQQFGILTAIEMITAMVIYIPVAHFADKTERKPFVLTTFIFFSAFPLVLLYSKTFILLILAFVIRGLKEFGDPTRKALIVELSNNETKARTMGLYYLIRDFLAGCAAFLGGYLWNISPGANLWTAFAFGIASTLIFSKWGNHRVNLLR